MRRVTACTVIVVAVTLLASCGGNDTTSSTSTGDTTATAPETTATTQTGSTPSVTSSSAPPSSESETPPVGPDASTAESATGTIQGLAFLCRAPGDCAETTSVAIQPADGSADRILVTTDPTGRFSYAVSPGDWQVVGRFTLGMLCDREPVTVTVVAGGTVDVGTFNCTPP
jgi:hypothetical protein